MFFSQATIGKNIKKHTKTNILLFSADIHTYKLTFVSFFYVFFLNLPLIYILNQSHMAPTPQIVLVSLRRLRLRFLNVHHVKSSRVVLLVCRVPMTFTR